jgi:hypothetical protein
VLFGRCLSGRILPELPQFQRFRPARRITAGIVALRQMLESSNEMQTAEQAEDWYTRMIGKSRVVYDSKHGSELLHDSFSVCK